MQSCETVQSFEIVQLYIFKSTSSLQSPSRAVLETSDSKNGLFPSGLGVPPRLTMMPSDEHGGTVQQTQPSCNA